ncbi:hypothetical protein LUZ60_000402 [Juncus effusus]|nr:hypothetical protein LUZ60_000402 [Juncus effusus]
MEEEEEVERSSATAAGDILSLPEELLKQVIIRTSPLDACRCSLASYFLCHVAQSDAVWDHFLPSDLPSIVDHPVDLSSSSSSKKELYMRLSDPNNLISIDAGRTLFGLERSTGAKCYTLSSRILKIEHGNNPKKWVWIPHPSSRFNEVAQLLVVYWLDIRGSIESTKLSPNTKYAAYLLFKLMTNSKGLKSTNMEASITVGKGDSKSKITSSVQLAERKHTGDRRYSSVRKDGWMEIEIAEFFNGDRTDTRVKFQLREIDDYNKKTGLLVEGMEIRPKI